MKTNFAMILLLVVLQAAAGEQIISVQHDSTRAVTCFITPQGGISCLPDSALQPRPAATPSSESGRASQASSTPENEPFVAGPNPGDERYQL